MFAKFRKGLPEGQPLSEEIINRFKEECKKQGGPKVSFSHREGTFKWEDVMDRPRTVEDPLLKMFQGWGPENFRRLRAE